MRGGAPGTCGVSSAVSVDSRSLTRRPMMAMSTLAPWASGLSKVPFTTGLAALSKLASPTEPLVVPPDDAVPDDVLPDDVLPESPPNREQPASEPVSRRAAAVAAAGRCGRRMYGPF